MVPMRYLKNGVSSQFFISSMVTAAIANLCVGGFFLLAFLVNRIKFYGFSFHVDTFSAICLQIDDNKMQIKSRFYSRMCGCVFFILSHRQFCLDAPMMYSNLSVPSGYLFVGFPGWKPCGRDVLEFESSPV